MLKRSRYNVGVRFLRRGINDYSEVANDVETELIVTENFPFQNHYKNLFSFAMIRGSIPAFWGHEPTKINPKPSIILNLDRDPEFKVSEIHFKKIIENYGNEICVLNLVKDNVKSTETVLGKIYKKFVDSFSNKLKTHSKGPKIRFKWIDFHSIHSKNDSEVMTELQAYAKNVFRFVGFFHYSMFDDFASFQKGVIRVNCIDCLDRTNNAMACIASVILANCLIKMDVIDDDVVDVDSMTVKNELLSILFEIFGVR